MLDCHIHLETGPYTLAWVKKYVGYALQRGLSEIHLLEHSYLFPEFLPMYKPVCMQMILIDAWLGRKVESAIWMNFCTSPMKFRRAQWPLPIQFGLEVCYFPGCEAFVESRTKNLGLDFLVGSIHFIDAFAFDHKPELWKGIEIDELYRRFFELSIQLASCGVFDGLAHPDSSSFLAISPPVRWSLIISGWLLH